MFELIPHILVCHLNFPILAKQLVMLDGLGLTSLPTELATMNTCVYSNTGGNFSKVPNLQIGDLLLRTVV